MKEIEQAATVLGGSPQTVDRRYSDFVTAFLPDGRIILPGSTFALKKWTLCCNCDFVYNNNGLFGIAAKSWINTMKSTE